MAQRNELEKTLTEITCLALLSHDRPCLSTRHYIHAATKYVFPQQDLTLSLQVSLLSRYQLTYFQTIMSESKNKIKNKQEWIGFKKGLLPLLKETAAEKFFEAAAAEVGAKTRSKTTAVTAIEILE